ncbi:MAG: Hint domain-containing protein [Alphaproteobacteria bacterium]|nr:Hint domain-containing protein [Alphaproteobacteria bacterium]
MAGASGAHPRRRVRRLCAEARLLLSPDHALFCDDALIPVQQLINGATILQEKAAGVHYFHVELGRHAVVLAEGLPAESYLNTGNRGQFENGGGAISLFADFAPAEGKNGCAPRLTRGTIVANVRGRVWRRAVALGTQERTAEISVEAAGRRLRAAAVRGRPHQFLLPAAAEEARIIAPAHARIGAILVDGRIVPSGLAFETGLGSDGRSARLRLPQRGDRHGSRVLELLLDGGAAPRAARVGAAA